MKYVRIETCVTKITTSVDKRKYLYFRETLKLGVVFSLAKGLAYTIIYYLV